MLVKGLMINSAHSMTGSGATGAVETGLPELILADGFETTAR